MQSYKLYSLVLLLCSTHALFGCEPSISVLDTTYGNASQASQPEGAVGTITQLPAGISMLYPLAAGIFLDGIYDSATERIISIGAGATANSSLFMVNDASGLITATLLNYQLSGTSTLFADSGLLTGSTTVAIGAATGDPGLFTLLFFNQEGALLNSNTQAFSGGVLTGTAQVVALEVVSTNTIVLAGGVVGEFALAFYNYDGVLTKTVLLPLVPVATSLAKLSDNSILAGALSIDVDKGAVGLAFERYTLNGDFINSVTYPADSIIPTSTFACVSDIVALNAGGFLATGGVFNPAINAFNPFLIRGSNDLETITVLRVIEEIQLNDDFVESFKSPSLVDDGSGHVIMTAILAEDDTTASAASTMLVKLTYNGDYDLSFGSCRGSQVLPAFELCLTMSADESPTCIQNCFVTGFGSIIQPDGKIITFGAVGIPEVGGIAANFKLTGNSITAVIDPLTAAIQRKYFGFNG